MCAGSNPAGGTRQTQMAYPQASEFGSDTHPDLHTKAAALLQSICSNHALVDGNKRLAIPLGRRRHMDPDSGLR